MADPEKKPDVSDAAVTRARQLLDKLWNDGKLGPGIRAEAKKLFPDIVIPEDTISPAIQPLEQRSKELEDKLAALQKKLDEKEKADAEAAANKSFETALEEARKKYSLTDEGFTKMVERMKATKNYTDAEAAAAWVSGQEPAPKPASGPSWVPQDLNLFGSKTPSDDFALLHKDTNAFFDQTVAQILQEAGTA